MAYKFYTAPANVPITQPLPGKAMVQNLAGGYAYDAGIWVALRRWLLTGSEKNTFYQTKEEQTCKNVEFLQKAIAEDSSKVAEAIVDASDKGINNHTPILALVFLSMGDDKAKIWFRTIFNKIIRTASHLYEFIEYVKDIRGFGQTIHKAVNGWILSKKADELEYQFLKYQNRNDWSVRDVLRKFKPVPSNGPTNLVFGYFAGKVEEFDSLRALDRIYAFETLKKGADEKFVVKTILDYNLTHEMIPGNIARTPGIWEALFYKMPINAVVRNLGNLTDKGVFKSKDNIIALEKKFNAEAIKRGRVHPIVLCSALKVYANPGLVERKSSLSWTAVPAVVDVLEEAIKIAFESVEPTNKTFYHAIDISGSMYSTPQGNLGLVPAEIAAIMTLATIKSERFYFTAGFSSRACDFDGIRKGTSFKDIVEQRHLTGAPAELRSQYTNLGSAIQYAIDKEIKADVLVFWTDGQSWKGEHPSVLMDQYRRKMNSEAKAIYVILGAYTDAMTLAKPGDRNSYDIAGFSSDTVKVIQMIASGDL
jgi:60 kDa SS-A/Ro ribonucleoprotein